MGNGSIPTWKYWRNVCNTVFFFCTVISWKHVISQCSEAHNTACSLPLMEMKQYELASPLGGALPDYNDTTLAHLCSIFYNLMDCSQPYLSQCDNETLILMNHVQSAFEPLCTYRKEYMTHRACYKGLEKNYKSCQDIRRAQLQSPLFASDLEFQRFLCNTTNNYAQCVYIYTHLGCSKEAAETYLNIINGTVTTFSKFAPFLCQVLHPNDEIEVFTTTTTTAAPYSTSSITYVTEKGDLGSSTVTSSASRNKHLIDVLIVLVFIAITCTII